MASQKISVVVAGTDKWHDVLGGGQAIRRILVSEGILAPLEIGLERFDEDRFCDAAAYVVYAMRPAMRPEAQEALAARVAEGTGLVVLHASNVVVDPQTMSTWLSVAGSVFERHGPFDALSVRVDQPNHPVTEGVNDFCIDDEPYEVALTVDDADILASLDVDGERKPMVYVRDHGKGRVCYIALGHDGRAWSHPAFQRMVVQAARWAGRFDD